MYIIYVYRLIVFILVSLSRCNALLPGKKKIRLNSHVQGGQFWDLWDIVGSLHVKHMATNLDLFKDPRPR